LRFLGCVIVISLAVLAQGCGGSSNDGAASVNAPAPAPAPNPSPTNNPPSISGTPAAQVTAGQNYSFTPQASDPEGAVLTFSIQNKPSWATFATASGRLSGTPSAGQVGAYAGVRISVSDGTHATNLADFSITVAAATTPPGTGSATLSWIAPTERTDGSTLTNLAGYRIRYGNARGNYGTTVNVSNPGLTTYVIDNLVSGTYYFVVTAYDGAGAESSFSNEASKTIS